MELILSPLEFGMLKKMEEKSGQMKDLAGQERSLALIFRCGARGSSRCAWKGGQG